MKYFLFFTLFIFCVVSQAAEPFKIKVRPSNIGTSANNQFSLPLFSGATYNFTIDWGDGSPTQIVTSDVSPTHTFSGGSEFYTISIWENEVGGFPRIYFNQTGDRHKLVEIVQWGDLTWHSFGSAFNGCGNLRITATDEATAQTGSVTDFSYAWYACGFTSFPLIDTSEGINFYATWAACSSLTSFPLIDTGKGQDFTSAWWNCKNLVTFPNINTSNGLVFRGAWRDCTGLTGFPALDMSKGTDFNSTWASCSGLTSFPLINTASGEDFSAAWFWCTGLTSFPPINTTSATKLISTWNKCTSLTSFPLIDTSNVTNFNQAWIQCVKLTTFPLLNTSKGLSFEFTWSSCTELTSFPKIDTSLAKNLRSSWAGCSNLITFPELNTANVTNFTSTWEGCKSLQTFPLIDTGKSLSFTRTWRWCSSLTSFPSINTSIAKGFSLTWESCFGLTSFPLIDTSSANSLYQTWFGCSSLTSIPPLNTSAVTNFTDTWYNCINLTSFPSIDTSNGLFFDRTWYNCTSLSTFPTLNLGKMTQGTDCFGNVTLSADSYSALLIDLAAKNVNTSVTFSGGLSKYNTSAINARNNILISDRSWIITDGGPLPPIITSSTNVEATIGSMFLYQIEAANYPTAYDATGLPANLTINTTTGEISGIPASPVGVSTVTISATNAGGTDNATLYIWVNDVGSPVITSANSTTAITGQPFIYQIVASNTPSNYDATVLPINGLSLDSSTGIISGTPSTTGVIETLIQATNANGTGIKVLTITVADPTGGGGGGEPNNGSSGGCGLGSGMAAGFIFAFGLIKWLGMRTRKSRALSSCV